MRLLNSRSQQLELLHRRVPYAIVSHRWGDESEEVLFTDIGYETLTRNKSNGFEKIKGSCAQAMQDGLNYVWLDTCCIQRDSSTELGEAINAMYKWYQESEVCYAYLHDVSDRSELIKSEWFLRGWTLQELIAPRVLKFFTKDWKFIGTREEWIGPIAELTGISPEILRSGQISQDVAISQRMFWAAKRETAKVEDKAYSLLGIFQVRTRTDYGIGDAAFEELQRSIILQYPDQTLFAWCYIAPQPEEVEMTDTNAAPYLDSAPDSSPEPVEDDTDTPSYTPTGFLASDPSQYLISYEISEHDFRKNYVDRIRDYTYRSNFSFTNNLVRIALPVKHVEGKLWKAVLRCSFEPPDGDNPQRPLVIYLEEIAPLKYVRVHLARDEAEEEGDDETDDETNDENSVPGSLERLSDAELKLEGYMVREIDVVSRHGEGPRARPSSSDPDSPSEQSEAERIAQLPRHPSGVKTTNIIVCGEPGVAAGRVINLIVGDTIIKPLTDYDRETMAVTVIDATLQSKNIRIFYIIGPKDHYLDLDTYHTTIRHMYQLVQQAKAAGGIHLVLLCMVGSRATKAVESNYRLFYEYICHKQVPTILVVTGLGKTVRMEDWWDKHKTDRPIQAMSLLDHVCITVLQGEDEEHEKKYRDSVRKIQECLVGFIQDRGPTPQGYCPEDVNRWFALMGRRAMDFLLGRRTLKQEVIEKTLKEGVHLNEVEASDLARQFFDETAVEV